MKHRPYMRQKYRVLGVQTARFLVSTSSEVGGEQANTKLLRVRGEVLRRKVCAGININTATLAPDLYSSQHCGEPETEQFRDSFPIWSLAQCLSFLEYRLFLHLKIMLRLKYLQVNVYIK